MKTTKKSAVVEPEVCFSAEDLMRLELSQTRTELVEVRFQVRQLELNNAVLQSQIQQMQLLDQRKELAAQVSRALGLHAELVRELEAKYRIDMKKIAYDDVTGKITAVEQ